MKLKSPAQICQDIMTAQREAAELILHAGKVLAENKSSSRDVVTQYDRRVQELLMERLQEAVPQAGFFCEESSQQSVQGVQQLFIIDPIDGTMNFVHHLNHSCISVAYMEGGELKAAAVYNPYVDEMFSAVKGEGAYLNGRRIYTDPSPLNEGLVCVGTSPYSSELTDRSFQLMKKAFMASLDLRRQGSAALDLCSVAAGRAVAYFELRVSFWDYAAGALIVHEAGGRCMRLEGGELPLNGDKTSILAGGQRAAAELAALLKD